MTKERIEEIKRRCGYKVIKAPKPSEYDMCSIDDTHFLLEQLDAKQALLDECKYIIAHARQFDQPILQEQIDNVLKRIKEAGG